MGKIKHKLTRTEIKKKKIELDNTHLENLLAMTQEQQ
jgi:hypothetical protein